MFAINRNILDNGLEVLHIEVPSTAMVAVNIIYKVGARNESPSLTGFAHLFEHLMFGGSVNVPDFDRALHIAGGESNAWTSNDITNFYEVLPACNIETAFCLESDRMRCLAFTPQSLEVQRNVVIEEFKERVLNQPYGELGHIIRRMAFKTHPYRWPVIGLVPEHIARAEMEQVKEFFYSNYAPNNAILSVVGNVKADEVFALARKWFGDIPRREVSSAPIPAEPQQTDFRFESVSKDVPQNVIYRGYKMCAALDSDYIACDLVSDILANGKSSRFYRNLVTESGLFASADAGIWGSHDPGSFTVSCVLMPRVDWKEANDAIDAQLAALVNDGVEECELEKCVNKWESREKMACRGIKDLAQKLAYYAFLGNADSLNTEIDRYRAVSPRDIMRVARNIFTPSNCSALHYGPDA